MFDRSVLARSGSCEEMTNSLILFGAGASFGSGEVVPKAPPIAGRLLAALSRLYPNAWGELSKESQSSLSEDFEAGMVAIGDRRPHALPPLERSMASFFFNFRPGVNNLYRELAQRMKKYSWSGALVTLNYERLLELSLLEEGLSPYSGTQPAKDDHPVELCLPHGCCHIFCESVRGTAAGISFSGQHVTTRGPVRVISDYAEFTRRIQEDAFPPVMSYFNPTKSTTSCANFIEEQRARYNEMVAGADVIAIVGVRVRPHDGHLWDALATTSGKLVYCSGASGAKEFEDWVDQVREDRPNIVLRKYFQEGFTEICEVVGLG